VALQKRSDGDNFLQQLSFVYKNDIDIIYDTNTMVSNLMNFGNEKENPSP